MKSAPELNPTLEQVLRSAGVGWLLQEDKDRKLAQVAGEISEFCTYLLHYNLVRTVDILSEAASEPNALRPLVQLFASPTSTPIRAMAYCILRGADIRAVSFEYTLDQAVTLRIELSGLRDRGSSIAFDSDNLWDAEVLRTFGMMKRGGRPVLHGYYAFAD